MDTRLMQEALRWIFWGVVYLAVALVAVIVALGHLAAVFPAPARWAVLGVFLYGLVLDARTKARRTPPQARPPSGGDLTPVGPRGL